MVLRPGPPRHAGRKLEGDLIDLGGLDATSMRSATRRSPSSASASGGNTYLEMQTGTSLDIEGVIRLAGIHTPEASWFVL
jgi:hypothetical protein